MVRLRQSVLIEAVKMIYRFLESGIGEKRRSHYAY